MKNSNKTRSSKAAQTSARAVKSVKRSSSVASVSTLSKQLPRGVVLNATDFGFLSSLLTKEPRRLDWLREARANPLH